MLPKGPVPNDESDQWAETRIDMSSRRPVTAAV